MLVFSNIKKALLVLVITLLISFSFISCGQADGSASAGTEESRGKSALYLFDYEDIGIETTSSIGADIKNCNVYLDLYGDLIIMGELENTAGGTKTDIEITIDLLGKDSEPIHNAIVPVKADYLITGSRYPFHYYYTEKDKYIELSTIKIGVNYKNYYKDLKGNPIAEIEDYSYEKDYLIIEGRVVNLGEEKIKDLKLLCTFYDKKDRVVFIKECYLPRDRMMPEEVQEFTLKILMDQYIKEFTHFNFQIFFEDEVRVSI